MYNTKFNLTNKQKKVLDFITNHIDKTGQSPIIEEIKSNLGFKSTRSVSQYLDVLIQKKYIKKGNTPRSIQLVDYHKKIENKTVLIPMYGLASCGTPEFYADDNIEEYTRVDKNFLRNNTNDYFFIKASGTSMNKAGIDNGALVLIEKSNYCDDNEKVLAVIDGMATIKKAIKKDNVVILMPNSTDDKHKPIIVREDFAIAGKVVCTLPDPASLNEVQYVPITE
ncbi:transcriptional repressor LexA [Patescibacteria group bacterium]|nr:transcriptional repressor LexA [Patescibacteria group bacterium]MBU0879454.1 transcriptional repressor LexA [Patescibacteria group bacterium]MBU0879961.1 transcriptional repressor LexA [Patescibacteria group bacterium]MBU0897936.1 transcriptional repressor LexA [Patescibacteria group bacterium]MBU1783450.1 transcriptional repressor LexA [Patescibacteria group bacterium]